jgi:hypothetical protein
MQTKSQEGTVGIIPLSHRRPPPPPTAPLFFSYISIIVSKFDIGIFFVSNFEKEKLTIAVSYRISI